MPTPISDHTVPWPDAAVADYVAKGYWAGAPWTPCSRRRRRRSDSPALVDPSAGPRLTHRELVDRADAAAARLLDLGMSRGDRIVVQLRNRWEFVVLTLACLRAGIIPVMALPGHRHTELATSPRMRRPPHRRTRPPRDFDHQALAHELADESAKRPAVVARPGRGQHVAPRASTCPPCARRGPGRPPRRGHPGHRGRRGLPALRRHDRPAEADRPHPRRLRLQRAAAAPRWRASTPTPCTW